MPEHAAIIVCLGEIHKTNSDVSWSNLLIMKSLDRFDTFNVKVVICRGSSWID